MESMFQTYNPEISLSDGTFKKIYLGEMQKIFGDYLQLNTKSSATE